MRVWRSWIPLLLLLLGVGVAAGAGAEEIQGQKPLLLLDGEFRFVPGAWASYRMHDKATDERYRLRIATLERQVRKGTPASWMEIGVETAKDPAVVTRLLAAETPQGPGELLEVIVQVQGYAPFVVPRKYFKGQGGEVGNFQAATGVARGVRRSISLNGRTLEVVEVEGRDGGGGHVAAMVSEAVPPIAIVEADTAALAMALEDWGGGAISEIKGEPMNFYWWLIKQIIDGLKSGGTE